MPANRCAAPRRGTVLILVAGISALLASLAVSFLVRMRTDAEESDRSVRLAQAHLMLVASCNFIQERSRMGWDDPNPPAGTPATHVECFGWVDIRDGVSGPRDQTQGPGDFAVPAVPDETPTQMAVGTWADLRTPLATRPISRQPMYVMRRPPFAVLPKAAPNAISTIPGDVNFGKPLATHCDPEPAVKPLPAADTPATWSDYATGDKTPLPSGQVGAWFRVLRDGPATFVVTCGCGGTMGFRMRDWDAVSGTGAMTAEDKALFGNDRDLFSQLEANEVRLWYRIEWSANVAAADYQCLQNEIGGDHWVQWPLNASAAPNNVRSQPHPTNMVGTIRWVQRLTNEPTYW